MLQLLSVVGNVEYSAPAAGSRRAGVVRGLLCQNCQPLLANGVSCSVPAGAAVTSQIFIVGCGGCVGTDDRRGGAE